MRVKIIANNLVNVPQETIEYYDSFIGQEVDVVACLDGKDFKLKIPHHFFGILTDENDEYHWSDWDANEVEIIEE